MRTSGYVRTDTAEDAISSLEVAAEFYERAMTDERYWKWFVVALHAGIQSLFALALDGGNGLLVQKAGVAALTLAAYEQGSTPPEPHMDNFMRLYKRLQVQSNLRFTSAQPLSESPQSERALEGLNSLRDEFLHFNTKSWSVERALVQARAQESVKVAEFIVLESAAILWYGEAKKERAYAAIRKLTQLLGAET
jgi:transcriptional regulator with XRE-family HTH domain